MSIWKKQKETKLFYTPCDGHQAGALVYTSRLYAKDDPDRKFPKWLQWLKLRDKWMTAKEEKVGKGNLTCAICGKTHLSPWTKDRKKLATIDHILPVSKFNHLWNVESNFQVACFRCNQNKRNN
jgi:5-methylcytosine-specific restriction endonuclease McrA